MNMDLNLAVQIANVLAPFAAAASIFLAIHVYRRQMNAQLFVAYTERYEKIVLLLIALPHLRRRAS